MSPHATQQKILAQKTLSHKSLSSQSRPSIGTRGIRVGYLRPMVDADYHRYITNSLNFLLDIINNNRNTNEIQRIIHAPRQREHVIRLSNYIKEVRCKHSLGKYTLFSPSTDCYEVCATLYKTNKMIAIVGRMEKINGRFAWKEIQILNA